MKSLVLLTLLATHAFAAFIQGVVLDFESGRPLARTEITLTPLQSGAGTPQTIRSGSNGAFVLTAAPGAYLLMLQRPGFAIYRHGAVCGACPGAALTVVGSADERVNLDIRMHRLGAITGAVLDENRIGIPEMPVAIYTATRPLRQLAVTKSDDRGAFRVGELLPGPYFVRSAPAKALDGVNYLATYYPDGIESRNAVPVTVELDRTWGGVDFPLTPGSLFTLKGKLLMPTPGTTNSVELISNTGRKKSPVADDGSYVFENVAPGDYEILADGRSLLGHFAAWTLFPLEHDMEMNVPMSLCPVISIGGIDANRRRTQTPMTVTIRRKDLDRSGPEIKINGPTDLPPGDWEILAVPTGDFFVQEIRVAQRKALSRSKFADDWVVAQVPAVGLPPNNSVQVSIQTSPRVATVNGRVTSRPNEVAVYAPVWLETMNLEPPDPPLVREVRTDANGNFEFKGLPPGRYRLLSTFDLHWSDRQAFETARPAEIYVAEGGSVLHDLSLYRKP